MKDKEKQLKEYCITFTYGELNEERNYYCLETTLEKAIKRLKRRKKFYGVKEIKSARLLED